MVICKQARHSQQNRLDGLIMVYTEIPTKTKRFGDCQNQICQVRCAVEMMQKITELFWCFRVMWSKL